MELHLKIIGWLLILLSAIHLLFPRYFKWKEELNEIGLINKQMMYVHTLFIALTVCIMGILCVTSALDILTTSLGKKLSLCFAVFWIVRLLVQFFGYSSVLWKNKLFETIVHILFSIFWIYMSYVFLKIYFINPAGMQY